MYYNLHHQIQIGINVSSKSEQKISLGRGTHCLATIFTRLSLPLDFFACVFDDLRESENYSYFLVHYELKGI